MRKKLLLGAAALVGLALVGLGGAVYGTFGGDSAAVEGEIAPGVTAVLDQYANVHVVEVDGGVVLVDAGVDHEARAVRERLAAMGDPPVLAVLLTHGHHDHVAGCGRFEGADVAAGAGDAALVDGTFVPAGFVGALFGGADGSCRVTRPVQDGDRLVFGGVEFTAFAVPGHTPGTTAWLGRRVLFLGDAASASTAGEVTGPKWIFSMDPPRASASLAALDERLDPGAVDRLAFGHTGPLDGLAPLARYTP